MSLVGREEKNHSHLEQVTLPWRSPSSYSPDRYGTNNGLSVESWQRALSDNSDEETEGGVLEDSLPPYCQFDKLDRAGAEKLLKEKSKDGMYLIREGSEGRGVLSVWLGGSCYHYMIYRDGFGSLFLTRQQLFSSLQALLQYYTIQSHLPRMEQCLWQPYQPAESRIPMLVKNHDLPKLKMGSAPELLDDRCRYSGWIRKQGGGHKNWKRRYLILRAGCLYYFTNETSSSPKGKFVLSGYHVEKCLEIKKFHHVLKLEPLNRRIRTYFIACSTSYELERWKYELEDEINRIDQLPLPKLSKSSSMSSLLTVFTHIPPPLPPAPSRHMTPPPTLFCRFNSPPTESPPDSLPDLGGHVYDELDYNESDSDSSFVITEPADYLEPQTYIDPAELLPVDKYYTRVTGDHNIENGYSEINDLSHNHHHLLTILPHPNRKDRSVSLSTPSTQTNQHLTLISDTSETTQLADREHRTLQRQSPISAEPATDPVCLQRESSNDSAAYYIIFPTPEEAMPPSCVFGQLSRTEADGLLKSRNEEGTYLIREGSAKAGSDKVLTVWHDSHCRHYKLFKSNESYFLIQGQPFSSLPALIQYYQLQSFLPQSDFYLKTPYKLSHTD